MPNPIDEIRIVAVLVIGCLLAGGAWAEEVPDFERLVTAIRKAEGNANYGILTRYKNTTPRQACLNTCLNQWKRHLIHKCGKDYMTCLRDRYAPLNAKNDPTGLNYNWKNNVLFFYNRRS